ncbi:kinase-like domain-containing protein [Cyathus striatus]|nr:kinase-like domain-containing protein [Cyathus striatus]
MNPNQRGLGVSVEVVDEDYYVERGLRVSIKVMQTIQYDADPYYVERDQVSVQVAQAIQYKEDPYYVERDQVSAQATQAIQHEEYLYYEDFNKGYSDGDEDAATISKVAREIMGGNMKGLSMNVDDGVTIEAIGTLCAEFAEAMEDKVKYRSLLTNRGGNAQKLVNVLQMLLDYPFLDQNLKSGLLKVLMRVSTRASVFPTCLALHDIQFEREPISDGFLSQIWQGTFQRHTVALKVIKIYREKHVNDLLKSLWREGIIWSHLSHPNVFPFYGIYHLHNMEEQVCLVSPWMNHGNIVDFLSRNSRADRVKLMFEVAKGMEYLHANNVVHGDLKGANMLITDTGQAVLCDFGLSTVMLDLDIMAYMSIETILQCSRTLRYQAPELFAPEEATEPKLTKECDIYSFSCLCYEVQHLQIYSILQLNSYEGQSAMRVKVHIYCAAQLFRGVIRRNFLHKATTFFQRNFFFLSTTFFFSATFFEGAILYIS